MDLSTAKQLPEGSFGRSSELPEAFHEWSMPDGTIWASFHRSGGEYLIRFPSLAEFRVSADGTDIRATPAPDTDASTLQHLRINQVEPLAATLRGHLVLHASAVLVNGKAVAFMGQSGRGKSTLAASFATNGFPFLTDDGLQLDALDKQPVACPSHASVRLWSDSLDAVLDPTHPIDEAVSFTPKNRIPSSGSMPHFPQAAPLQAIYLLEDEPCTATSIKQLSAAQACMAFIRNSFLMDIEDHQRVKAHFDDALKLAEKVPAYTLNYPRHYGSLDVVRESILNHVKSLP